MAGDKLAAAAVRWWKRLRQTDDLSRLVKAASGTSVQISRDEIRSLRKLLEEEQTWRLLAGGRLHIKLEELTGKVADCLPARDGWTVADARDAAGTIARGLVEFAVFELQPEIFQKVVLGRLQQMTDQTSAVDAALFRMHKDLYRHVGDMKDLFNLVSDRLPPGPADLGEIKIYLTTLINWLNTDPWPQDQRLGGPVLTPAAIERKLRVSAASAAREQVADADELARRCSRLVILGAPGSGKTWLAMRTARICAEEALQSLQDGATLDEVELPLYTTCSHLIATPGGIREAAVTSALNWVGDLGGSRIIKALFLSLTERRDEPTLLVIDSLDEASDANAARERLRQVDSLKQPWRVVLTSRPSSWNNQLKIEKEDKAHWFGELQPLRYPNDVESVIAHWFADDPDSGQALTMQISQHPSLQQGATVPLILAFYCILGGQHRLPEFRHKLYEQVINRMLHSPWRSSSGHLPDAAACREALRNWAWQAAKDQNHPISGVGQWEDNVLTKDAQLSPAGQVAVDHIAAPQSPPDFDTDQTRRRFVHRSIREYLVAAHIASLPAAHAAQELLPHLWYDPDWEYAAPAALAMHPQHNKVLQELICRTTGSDQPANDISAIDGCWEFRRFLMAVAAESSERDWSPEAAQLIGQARTDFTKSRESDLHLLTANYWPTSNRLILQWLLGQVARDTRTVGDLEWTGALTRLAVTFEERTSVRQALLALLAHKTTSSRLLDMVTPLAATPLDRARSRQALLALIAPDTIPKVVRTSIDAVTQLAVTVEERTSVRHALLALIARAISPGWAAELMREVSRLDPPPEDQASARQALLTQLVHVTNPYVTNPWMTQELANAMTPLAVTPGKRAVARQALLALLVQETNPGQASDLAYVVSRLDPPPEDKASASQALLALLPHATNPMRASELADAIIRLDPPPEDKASARRALLAVLAYEKGPGWASELAAPVTRLAATLEDHVSTRQALLMLLAHETDPGRASEFADAITRLNPPPEDQASARQALLALLADETSLNLTWSLTDVVTRLNPPPEARAASRQAMLALLAPPAHAIDRGWTQRLAEAITRLAVTPGEQVSARQALLTLLAQQTDPGMASALTDAITRLNPPPEDQASARQALLALLAHQKGHLRASGLADSLGGLDPTVADLGGLATSSFPRPAALLAAVRRNSELPDWLAALPLISIGPAAPLLIQIARQQHPVTDNLRQA